MDYVFDIQKDHEGLIHAAMSLLEEGGELIFSNNFRKFKISEGLKELYDVKDISAATIPEDFKRNQKIHRCYVIKAL